jgi:tetratricopeptide (TPR) repeat protein
MKIPNLHLSPCLVAVALAAVLPMGSMPVFAQDSGSQANTPARKSAAPMTMREKREARLAELRGSEQKSPEEPADVLYPLATRADPGIKPSRTGIKRLQKMADAYQGGENDAAIAAALESANDPESNAYEKSFSMEIAGNAASNKGDEAAAAEYFTRALASNGLGNNDFYTVMYNLAIVQYGLEQYGPALQTLDRYLAETRTDKLEAQKLRGGLLFGLERYADAAAQYAKLLAAHPDDKSLRVNAAAAYQQAEQPEKAMALLKDAQAKGQLTEANEYRALYVSYINADQAGEAVAVIDDGLAKGVLQANADLAKSFMVLGQKAYYDNDLKMAAEMYKRAAPIAEDGEAALNLAKIYAEEGKKSEAKAAAQQALQKGVKDTAGAKRLAGGA